MTRAQLEAREKAYTTRATPVGIIFGIGLVVALVIGIIICHQLLFNEIQDHLRQTPDPDRGYALVAGIVARGHPVHLKELVLISELRSVSVT